ncbi:MAG: NADH-quinone oxidoreductase subunit M [Gemmatimonadetes bacterium]|nr:NADH-quinone oxidoreductase subunit M [Gemmatimonadota bacterium]
MRTTLLSAGITTWLLPALLVWPVAAAVLVRLLGRERVRDESGAEAPSGGPDARALTLGALVVEAALGVLLWMVYDPARAGWQARVDYPWIADLGATISLGVDGLSMPLVVMTTLLLPITLLGAWNNVRARTPAFGALALLLTSGLVGVFIALDTLLFYLAWELMLIPTYLLVGVWGAAGQSRAALRYVLFTLVGSLLLLVALLVLWNLGGANDFHVDHLALTPVPPSWQVYLFLAFFAAFAVKSALVPFHTWFPDAQGAAPTFAAVTIGLKVGVYGLLRFASPFFPTGATYPPLHVTILVLSLVTIFYGGFLALAQRDLKRVIAYSAISHLGFIMLGAFVFTAEGAQGAAMSIVNSGLTTAALFLLAGALEDRTGTTELAAFGGLAARAPWFGVSLVVAMLATVGLPGTSGFVGEFLILFGTWPASPLFTVIAATGVILAAAYGLRAVQLLLWGSAGAETSRVTDLDGRERLALGLLLAGIIGLGVAPAPVLRPFERAGARFVESVQMSPNAPVTYPSLWPFSR